jgi:hypothetical protein
MAAAEQKKQYHVSKAFKSLNTKANRTAIDDDEFSWIENAQPIGSGNIKIIPGVSAALDNSNSAVVFTANVQSMFSVELKNKTYLATFQDNGGSQFYDVDNKTVTTVVSPGTLSTSNVTAAQFNNTDVVIADPTKGLFVYDGNVTVQLGAGGVIGMLNIGSGYTSAPSVVVSAPDQAGGIQATAQAIITSNTVSEVVWTQPGTGYTKPPTLTLSGGGGTGAQAISSLLSFRTGQIYYQLLNGGQGYTSGNVVVTGGGGDNTAVGTFICSNGTVVNIIPTSLGNNYVNTANLVVTINGTGSNACVAAYVESNVVTSVSTYAGRVWVSQGRELIYSASTNFNDFISPSAGNLFVNDSTLHGNILGTLPANNFLYFFGDDSINIISDVSVNNLGFTNLTNTNVSASIGTRRVDSIFPYYRYVMFQNDYGVYGLIGSTTVKLSDALDGIYTLIDFTKPVTGGQVIINNILCACFNFYCNNLGSGSNAGVGGSRWVQAVFFDKKWFITSQGAINYIVGTPVAGELGIYGTVGNQLYRLYNDTSNNISSVVQTALWPMGDPIRDKQGTRLGVEAIFPNAAGTINVTIDNPYNTTGNYTLTSYVSWKNYQNVVIPWENNSNTIIPWTGGLSGYQLYRLNVDQPVFNSSGQKYLGLTLTSNTAGFTYSTFELEYEMRARF